MSSDRHARVECEVCDNEMRSDNLKRHMQRADHQSGREMMSSFPSDEQFDQCVAADKRAAEAIDWKDLPTTVVYRVQPQGSVETKRGSDTVLDLVNRNNEEVKVWAPPSLMLALYSAPSTKKIAYIRSLGVHRKRKVFETVFFQDHQQTSKKKSKMEEEKGKRRTKMLRKKSFAKEKKSKMERKTIEKIADSAKSIDELDAKINISMDETC